MFMMVLSIVRYAPPMSGSEMRLKKVPMAVNMSVEEKDVSSDAAVSAAKDAGAAANVLASAGKSITVNVIATPAAVRRR